MASSTPTGGKWVRVSVSTGSAREGLEWCWRISCFAPCFSISSETLLSARGRKKDEMQWVAGWVAEGAYAQSSRGLRGEKRQMVILDVMTQTPPRLSLQCGKDGRSLVFKHGPCRYRRKRGTTVKRARVGKRVPSRGAALHLSGRFDEKRPDRSRTVHRKPCVSSHKQGDFTCWDRRRATVFSFFSLFVSAL